MGTFLNPGKQSFQMAVNSRIFVDKTKMIAYLNSVVNTQQRFVSVSRPRRFGKTMAADMICAYYDRTDDSRELFKNRKLASCVVSRGGDKERTWDEYLGKFDVIRVVMTRFINKGSSVPEALKKMQRLIIREMKKEYPDVDYFSDDDLIQALDDIYADNKRQVVIVIDEWDAVFRERQSDRDGQTEYLDFLRDLMKDNSHIALAYMTGILPIKKYGKHSALNMFTEYSMMFPRQMAQFTGFTEEEVKDLCKEYGRDYESIIIHLGYLGFDDEKSEVFIPNREIRDEFKTSTRSEEWLEPLRAYEESRELLKATWEEDAEKVAGLIEAAHDRAGNTTYNNEALSCQTGTLQGEYPSGRDQL